MIQSNQRVTKQFAVVWKHSMYVIKNAGQSHPAFESRPLFAVIETAEITS